MRGSGRGGGGEEANDTAMARGPKTVCPSSRFKAVRSVWQGPQRHGRDKVGFGQILKGSTCHTKELGALPLVMTNQMGLRETKVQTEATFSLKKCFISPMKYVSIIGISCQCLNRGKFLIKIWIPGFLTTITMATQGQPQVVTIVWT